MYPILFSYGDLTVRTYTVIVMLAMVAAMVPVHLEAKRLRWPIKRPLVFVAKCTLAGWIGAHAMYMLTRFDLPWDEWLFKAFINVGVGNVWFGGVLLAWLYVYLVAKRSNIQIYEMYDTASLAAILALGFGRWACMAGGCCYGSPTDLPWGYHLEHTREGYTSALHPVPVYEFIFLMFVFAFLWSRRKRAAYRGQLLVEYLWITSAGRFLLEFLRGDTIRGTIFGLLTTSQVLGLGLFVAAFFIRNLARQHPMARAEASHTA